MGLTIGLEGREHARRNRGEPQRKRETRERSQMRKSWILALTGVGFAALTAPARAEDITIAVAGPMTGTVARIGEQMNRGAETAAAAINDAGGGKGRKITIVIG